MHTCEALERNSNDRPTEIGFVEGKLKVSWSEMKERVLLLAKGLQGLGCGKGDFIGILAENSLRVIEATYAVQWLGASIVPLNTRWTAPEISFALEDASIRVLISDTAKDGIIEQMDSAICSTLTLITDSRKSAAAKLVDYEALIANSGPANIPRQICDEASLASLFYTGGTTGRSKGVKLTHQNHVTHSLAILAEIGLGRACKYLHAAPMFHIADSLFIHVISLRGGQHVILPRFDPASFASAVIEHEITDTILVPTMIQAIFNAEGVADRAFSNLQRLYYGASPMPEALLHKILDQFPDLELIQFYGQTEASPVISILPPEAHSITGDVGNRMKSAGRPMMTTEVRIVDDEDKEIPAYDVGEIVVRGPQVMCGYHNRPEETAAALRNGWLHTGDAGYLDTDGFLYVTDRVKDMIITGGENVYSVEVEQVLYDLDGVAECCVVGLPHEKWGEIVHAVIVPQTGHSISEESVKTHCKKRLADYKRPKSVTIRTEALPLSGAGKILKRKLRELYSST